MNLDANIQRAVKYISSNNMKRLFDFINLEITMLN